MTLLHYIQFGIASLITIITIFTLVFIWKMIKFACMYGKRWGWAWKVFFVAICLILVRRGIGIVLVLGNGNLSHTLTQMLFWADYIGIATACSILYVIFVYLNYTWWKMFFEKYRIEETVVKQVVAEDANHVEVEDALKVEVDLQGKQVVVEKPKRVIVEKPKKVDIKKDGVE
jgi:hypothetical protein